MQKQDSNIDAECLASSCRERLIGTNTNCSLTRSNDRSASPSNSSKRKRPGREK